MQVDSFLILRSLIYVHFQLDDDSSGPDEWWGFEKAPFDHHERKVYIRRLINLWMNCLTFQCHCFLVANC